MRDKIPSREVIVGCGRITVSQGHDERHIFASGFLVRVGIGLFHHSGRFNRARQSRVFHHFAELVDIVCPVISMFRPNIQ